MTIDELKELIRTEPTIRDTFEAVEAEHTAAAEHTRSLADKRAELLRQLKAIDAAKTQLVKEVESVKDENQNAERESRRPNKPAAKPKSERAEP